MSFAKVFKKINKNSRSTLYLRPYDVENQQYLDIIKDAQSEGLSQVIINSQIMIDFLSYTLEKDGIILKIQMNNYADVELKDDIMAIVRKLRKEKHLFQELKQQLSWALDSESIDILSITIALKIDDSFPQSWEIFSNGIIVGEDIEKFFRVHLCQVVEGYLNASS